MTLTDGTVGDSSRFADPSRFGDPNRFGTPAFYVTLGRAFVVMCGVIPILFAIELLDVWTHHELDVRGGIIPHNPSGLDGVVFAPFLHADFNHLYGNSVPLLLTGTFVLATGSRRFLAITAVVALASGLGVWFTGDPRTVVIGASGVIFGYLGFLLARGVVERSWWGFAVGLLVFLLYGTQLVNVLPTDARLSWQAHLFGLGGGVLAAFVFRRRRPAPARPAGPPPRAGRPGMSPNLGPALAGGPAPAVGTGSALDPAPTLGPASPNSAAARPE